MRCILIYPADGHGANRVARERRAAEGGECLELGSRGPDSNPKALRVYEEKGEVRRGIVRFT